MNRLYTLCIIAAALLAAPAARADTKAFDAGMRALLTEYLKAHKPLYSDTDKGVAAAAKAMAKLAAKLNAKGIGGKHAKHYAALPGKLKAAALALHKAKGIEKQRDAFKVLSRSMVLWATLSKPKGVVVIYCSMTKGSWLQLTKAIRNPYHGAKMLYCGQIVSGKK